ncbi:HAD-IIA family hydrolase [Paenibacillus koleovorans]|uniref:HAD-IIA family hydrolase n=1 Tax=Paenibacillus koleovorans TaxID=121608 RepID=UPI002482F798|nr:HAD-IIA family hydrolase [Paenibacillus koleovorans]
MPSDNKSKYGFLIDLDGTMYAGHREIPDAAPFIKHLRERGWPFLFVTNNSSRTPEAVADHLRHMGIDAAVEEVVTSAQAAAEYVIQQSGGRATVYAIGEVGLRTALQEAGLHLLSDDYSATQAPPDFVVQGIDRDFHYAKLHRAATYLRAGARYVLTNPDRAIPSDDTFLPGAGSLAASIRMASEVEPVVIGKPNEPIVRFALGRLQPAEEVWVVGDNLWTDIASGEASGLRTALVLTGLATADNLQSQLEQSGVKPDRIAANLLKLFETFG